VQYERLYHPNYKHPQTYIRFSTTVEDSIGCPYCINSEDDIYLINLNASYKKASKTPLLCSEDQFETVMYFFEETSAAKQPYASVDNAPVLPFIEMEASYDETIDEISRRFAKDIYEHWKTRRLESQNHPLMPTLRYEKNAETDDGDPYVCFRRREVRQARKTRGRDAQITEKLKRLRQELEQARQLLDYSKQREVGRRDQMKLDLRIFEHRTAVKEAKRNLGIKGDDQDLVNHRPIEKPIKSDSQVLRAPGMLQKVSMRPDGRMPDSDLQTLAEDRLRRENEVSTVIQDMLAKHKIWNNGYVDNTWRPITPPLESSSGSSFRAAVTEYLPTPPSSAASADGSAPNSTMVQRKDDQSQAPFRYASPPMEQPAAPRPSFRRRVGRGGRMWIDRRGISKKRKLDDLVDGDNDRMLERMQFDVESDEDEEVYLNDPYSDWNMRYRLMYITPMVRIDQDTARSAAVANRMLLMNGKRPGHGQAVAPTATAAVVAAAQQQQQQQASQAR
jgi:enhancer of polycomb-like protein